MKTKKKNSKTNKTMKKNNDNVKSCMNTKCQLWLEQVKVMLDKMKKNIKKKVEKKEKMEKKICVDDNKKEQCENLKSSILFSKGLIEDLHLDSEKNKKVELDICKELNCNEGCKDTVLEDGEPDILPKSISNKFKKMKDVLEIVKKRRKDIFKNKKTVLKDGFYEGLKPSLVNKMKKEGAISYCSEYNPK